MVGSLFDLADAEETESVLSRISASARPGRTTLLAQVGELKAKLPCGETAAAS